MPAVRCAFRRRCDHRWSEAGGIASTAQTGTLARIIDWQQEEDGLLGLLCEGEQVFSLEGVSVEHDKLLRAEIVRCPLAEPQPLPEGLSWMAGVLDDLLRQMGAPFERLAVPDPSADHVAARLIEILPLPLVEKQALFDTNGAIERLRRLAGLIQLQPDD